MTTPQYDKPIPEPNALTKPFWKPLGITSLQYKVVKAVVTNNGSHVPGVSNADLAN